MIYIVLILGISLWVLAYQILSGIFSKNNYVSRIGIYTGQVELPREDRSKKQDTYRQGLGFLAKGIERSGAFSNLKAKIRKNLIKANVLMKPEEYLAICLLLFGFFGILGALMLGESLLILIPAFLGWFLPSILLKRNIAKRLKTINSQLGDTIAILSNAMKAGHSFFQAVDSVSREMTGPVADEFMKLQKEISLGVNTETALENMVGRVGSDDLELMVTAVLIQRQIGGNLAEILDNISGTIRQRIRTKGEIKALTAQGRMSGWIISLLPFGLAGVVGVISPQQILTLIHDPLGIMMIAIALVMEAIGIVFIRKIISIEV
ncbi:MAG: type II secretion system F family protein [Clostridia bacterium]|nr:type II secretion system F family protein [Clostridia bacterium]